MPTPNPEHLFDQAEKFAKPPAVGSPRQVDLRCAISAAYYGLFHAILAAAADELVGSSKRSTARYSLAYRSIDHRALRSLCGEVQKPTLNKRYAAYAPAVGFGPNIGAFASALIDLQDRRVLADYDPLFRVRTSDAAIAIRTARSALRSFEKASRTHRTAFLSLLLFPPRQP